MKVYLRKIQEKDLEMIRKWRMREDITKYMNTDPVLTLEGQQEWLKKIEQDNTVRNWVIEVDDIPVGVLGLLEIDEKNQRCSWGYYIAEKKCRSLKLAMAIEWNLYDYVFEKMKFNKLMNEVLAFNKEVVTIHKMCGSECVGTLKAHVFKKDTFYDVVLIEITKERWVAIREKYIYERAIFE